jgi:hypothetical protein
LPHCKGRGSHFFTTPLPVAFVLCPNRGRGGGTQPEGQGGLDRIRGKYLLSGQEGGWAGPNPGSQCLLRAFFFFFPFPLLSSFSWPQQGPSSDSGPWPPPRRVTQASAICLLPGWGRVGKAGYCRQGEGVGRFPRASPRPSSAEEGGGQSPNLELGGLPSIGVVTG